MNSDLSCRSLVDRLPSCFREQGGPKEPLYAILLIADDVFSHIATLVDNADRYFDPTSAPAQPARGGDFLTWLSSWVGLVPDETWPEVRKRYLIRSAAELYRYRGTCEGLKYMIERFFGIEADIQEWTWPAGMVIGSRSAVGINTHVLERTDMKHCFTVVLKPAGGINDNLLRKIRKVIDLEKPAHTKCWLEVKKTREQRGPKVTPMIIGITSTIGSCFISREVHDGGRLQEA